MMAETVNADPAIARQRLLVVMATLLESLHESTAVPVLATLNPGHMQSGGARIPGTSYELTAARAAKAMEELLLLRGAVPQGLCAAFAQADLDARFAALTGKDPPRVSSLYSYCTNVVDAGESFPLTLLRLLEAVEAIFTPQQARRLDNLLYAWGQAPLELDAMPVQRFVAQFVRNAAP
ncbi:MAG: hypothetical protein ABI616_03020 [Pseudomonadota bacterium]